MSQGALDQINESLHRAYKENTDPMEIEKKRLQEQSKKLIQRNIDRNGL